MFNMWDISYRRVIKHQNKFIKFIFNTGVQEPSSPKGMHVEHVSTILMCRHKVSIYSSFLSYLAPNFSSRTAHPKFPRRHLVKHLRYSQSPPRHRPLENDSSHTTILALPSLPAPHIVRAQFEPIDLIS